MLLVIQSQADRSVPLQIKKLLLKQRLQRQLLTPLLLLQRERERLLQLPLFLVCHRFHRRGCQV